MEELRHVIIYTDGACSGNPGPGGYAALLLSGKYQQELSGGFRRTTNNRMELMAAIVGLRAVKRRCRVTLYSDSRYLVESITKGWVARWRANGWKKNAKEKAVNPDLWEELLQATAPHEVEFQWVRGHVGHAKNEQCDKLAVAAAQRKDLPPDTVYETLYGATR